MGVYQFSSNYSPGVNLTPPGGGGGGGVFHKFYIGLYRENFRIVPVSSYEA